MTTATAMLTVVMAGVVSVFVPIVSMGVFVGILAVLSGNGTGVSGFVRPCARVFGVARRLGSPRVVARHGSECLGPHMKKSVRSVIVR